MKASFLPNVSESQCGVTIQLKLANIQSNLHHSHSITFISIDVIYIHCREFVIYYHLYFNLSMTTNPYPMSFFGGGVPTGMDTVPKPQQPKQEKKIVVNSGVNNRI